MKDYRAVIMVMVVGVVSAILMLSDSAYAVRPGEWVHKTESDFENAELDETVVTNLGEVKLARIARDIAELEGEDAIVYDIVRKNNGMMYIASGPVGKLWGLDPINGELTLVFEYENEQVFALTDVEDGLWVGVSGSESRLELRGNDDEVVRSIALPGVRYVWSVLPDGDGEHLWVATGIDGKVLFVSTESTVNADEQAAEVNEQTAKVDEQAVDADEQTVKRDEQVVEADGHIVALESKQHNILCLGINEAGQVFAGTDGEGLVYRITRLEKGNGVVGFDVFIVFDANEPEIGALLVASDGMVYVGTADADHAKPGRMNKSVDKATGRPEKLIGDDTGEENGGKKDDAAVENDDGDEAGEEGAPEPEGGGDADDSEGDDGTDNSVDSGSFEEEDDAREEGEDEERNDNEVENSEADGETSVGGVVPSAEQYEALREVVMARLEGAKSTGTLAGNGEAALSTNSVRNGSRTKRSNNAKSRRKVGGPSSVASSDKGNAIYAIDHDGFVREVFRESVMILDIAEQGDTLLVATGNEGQLYQVDPVNGETTVLIELKAKQIPALLLAKDGSVTVGTANPGLVLSVGEEYSFKGTYVCDVLDASQISLWGKLRVVADVPDDTKVSVQTRSGNVADPESGGWSEWSAEGVGIEPDFFGQPEYVEVTSPAARFVQYRLVLDSGGDTTPRVEEVSLKYLVPNIEPRISSLKAEYEGKGKGKGKGKGDKESAAQRELKFEWEASDANEDELIFKLEMRELGSDGPFILLADDVKGKSYVWNTLTVPDGRYIVRLEASDSPDNVPGSSKIAGRLSRVILVDNTPPVIDEVVVKVGEKLGDVIVSCKASDKLCEIIDLRYSVNGGDNWEPVMPLDMIYDSTTEEISFIIHDLSSGPAVVTLRVTDALGNTNHVSRTVVVPR